MLIITADDEQLALDMITDIIRKVVPDDDVYPFCDGMGALDFARTHRCDTAFLDINMRQISGLALAKALKEINPKINIIFVTGYDEYMKDAFGMFASGYVMKPPTADRIRAELGNLRFLAEPLRSCGRIRVQTFGNFEVFADGMPMRFRYSKSKELFAYLIDRKGAAVNTSELCAVLWEDKPVSVSLRNQLRNLISDLCRSLKNCCAESVMVKKRNSFAVDTNMVDCDFYRFLKKEPAAVNSYGGEYMTQYSWAEMTLGYLEQGIK